MGPDFLRKYNEALQDEEIERRAWDYFEVARAEGSKLSDEALIEQCRQMAKNDIEQLSGTGDEVVPDDFLDKNE